VTVRRQCRPLVQVQLDVPHHTTMLELHQRAHPKHTVVGWFSTGLNMSSRDALIHSFYSKGRASGCGVKAPMHLVVDTALTVNDRVSIKAHVARKLMLGGQEIASEFVEVPATVLTSGAEGLALDALREEKLDAIHGDSENFRKAFATLQGLIGQAHEYVTAVVEGRREADVTVGRCAACARCARARPRDCHALTLLTHSHCSLPQIALCEVKGGARMRVTYRD
jgi:translation initiation factor 3 subunit F